METICNRCGVVNRAGRVACVHCMARLDPASATGPVQCVNHPNVPATGRCLACGKFVCDGCGGIISNRGVYCVDDAAMAMAGAMGPAPAAKAPKPPKAPKVKKGKQAA